jgi:hypothetical protein
MPRAVLPVWGVRAGVRTVVRVGGAERGLVEPAAGRLAADGRPLAWVGRRGGVRVVIGDPRVVLGVGRRTLVEGRVVAGRAGAGRVAGRAENPDAPRFVLEGR